MKLIDLLGTLNRTQLVSIADTATHEMDGTVTPLYLGRMDMVRESTLTNRQLHSPVVLVSAVMEYDKPRDDDNEEGLCAIKMTVRPRLYIYVNTEEYDD